MITYEKLRRLEDNCYLLLKSTFGLLSDDNTNMKEVGHILHKALRKIVIANEMINQNIICVSGLQGSGKTTLIKNYYQLSEEYMNIVEGRGERIPILISEKKDCQGVELYKICLLETKGDYWREEIKITDNKEFIKASEGNDDNVMYLEIRLPYRRIGNESTKFLLLPGWENKNDYWRTLIDFSVNCSKTAIFVVSPEQVSSENSWKQIKKVKERFKDNLIYVISHSDESPDDNAAVRDTFIRKQEMTLEGNDRVICTGAYWGDDIDKNEKWIEELNYAIEKMGGSNGDFQDNGKDYILDLIDNIQQALSNVEEGLKNVKIDTELENGDIEEIIEIFDDVVKKRKSTLKNKLNMKLNEAVADSQKKLRDILQKEKKTGYIRKKLFGENLKDIEHAHEILLDSLKTEDGHLIYQEKICTTLMENISNEEDTRKTFEKYLPIDKEEGSKSGDISKNPERADETLNVILGDCKTLLDMKEENAQLHHPDIQETFKVLAEMGVHYYYIFNLNEMLVDGEKNKKDETTNIDLTFENIGQWLADKSSKFSEQVEAGKQVEKTVLATLGVLGIDASDGALNVIPAIAAAVHLPVPVVDVGTAILVGSVMVKAVINDVNRMQIMEQNAMLSRIESLRESIERSFWEQYDTAMELLRNRLIDRMCQIRGIYKKAYKSWNAQAALKGIYEELENIYDEVAKQDDITGAFQG